MESNCFLDLDETVARLVIDAQGVRLKPKPAVYLIENTENNTMYVGSTSNMCNRSNRHRHTLIEGSHSNVNLQREFDGAVDKTSLVLHVGYFDTKKEAVQREQDLLDEGFGSDLLLNINATATKDRPNHQPVRQRQEIIDKMLETKNTDEHRRLVSDNSKRMWESPEYRRKTIDSMGDSVVVDGVKYGSYREASRETGVSILTIRKHELDGCMSTSDVQPTTRKVSMDGVVYDTVTKAAEAAGVAPNTMTYRCKSDGFSDTFYVES